MNRLLFLLSSPKHRLYKSPHGLMGEDLVFDNARIEEGIGEILISREYHNGERGEKFATMWETQNASAEDFYGNAVTIHNLNEAFASKMKTWNEGHPDDKYTDGIIIDRSLGLDTHVHLPTEQFSRLLQVNWKEHVLKLTLSTKQSLEGLKLGFSAEGRNALREGGEAPLALYESDEIAIEIENYEIVIEEFPNKMSKGSVDLTQAHMIRRLYRVLLGR